jgi:hypothetical protein
VEQGISETALVHLLYTPHRRLPTALLASLSVARAQIQRRLGYRWKSAKQRMKERRAVVGGWVAEEVAVLRRGVDGVGLEAL